MLIPLGDVIAHHNVDITGIIHAGAHLGEEAGAYEAAGVERVLWIEANPALIDPLRAAVPDHHRVVSALLGAQSGPQVEFRITNNGQSSSVLDFGTHSKVSPDVRFVDTVSLPMFTLDEICQSAGAIGPEWNFLNMDLQGYELECLKGAPRVLENIDCIYTEVNEDELYLGCARLPELDSFLGEVGFRRVATKMAGSKRNWVGWGDAVYVRY